MHTELKTNAADSFFGRMNDPTAAACGQGPCGDSMEMYLVIENNTITEIKYYTEGCEETKRCAGAACALASGAGIQQALSISAHDVIQTIGHQSDDHTHCAILAVSTLYRSIADYLLKR